GFGINVSTGAGYSIYYNTVVMTTNQTTGTYSAAFGVDNSVTAAGAINLRDNIFVNNQTGGATNRTAFMSLSAATIFSAQDYNDYFSPGGLGFGVSSTLPDLTAMQ